MYILLLVLVVLLIPVLWISNRPPRYLSEFLFGGPVAGPVIYYLFEILYFSHFAGKFAAGELSFIFWKS
jgi:hypothetical protein